MGSKLMPAISYWCPIGTEPLSLTLFEIFGTKNRARAHTHRRTDTSDYIFFPRNVLRRTDKQEAKLSLG